MSGMQDFVVQVEWLIKIFIFRHKKVRGTDDEETQNHNENDIVVDEIIDDLTTRSDLNKNYWAWLQRENTTVKHQQPNIKYVAILQTELESKENEVVSPIIDDLISDVVDQVEALGFIKFKYSQTGAPAVAGVSEHKTVSHDMTVADDEGRVNSSLPENVCQGQPKLSCTSNPGLKMEGKENEVIYQIVDDLVSDVIDQAEKFGPDENGTPSEGGTKTPQNINSQHNEKEIPVQAEGTNPECNKLEPIDNEAAVLNEEVEQEEDVDDPSYEPIRRFSRKNGYKPTGPHSFKEFTEKHPVKYPSRYDECFFQVLICVYYMSTGWARTS